MTAKPTRAKPSARRKTSTAPNETDVQFAPIIEVFRNNARVSLARMFGSVGLKVTVRYS